MNPERIYRCLLRLLPAAFRREAEAELLDIFRTLQARADARGGAARLGFWLRMTWDLAVTVAAEHSSAWPRRAAPDGRRRRSLQILPMIEGITGDVRVAARALTATPGWTIMASGTLALGLAACLVGGILLRDVVLRPLPFPEAERMVRVLEVSDDGRRWWPSWPNARDWRQHARAFDRVAIGGTPRIEPVILEGRSVRAAVARAGLDFFDTFATRPVAGRLFRVDEHESGSVPAAVVTNRFWRGPLQGRPLGELALTVGAVRYEIVGVLADDFRFLGEAAAWSAPADVWIPLERHGEAALGRRTSHGEYHVVGRLRAGLTLEQAQQEMNALAGQLRTQHREPTQAASVLLTPLRDVVVRSAREPLRMLVYAGLAVLIVAGINLASAILAQGLSRTHELQIRQALGATRARLVAHLLAGAAVLALPGAILGLLLAAMSIRLLRSQAAGMWPRLDEVVLDPQSVMTAFALAALTALLAAMAPAALLSSTRAREGWRSRGGTALPRESRLWKAFVTLQIAVTVTLMVTTGLLVRSFIRATEVDLGYQPGQVLAVAVTLPPGLYADAEARHAYFDRALEALRAATAFEAVGLTSVLPQDTTAYTSGTGREAQGARTVMAGFRLVDPGYFGTLDIPVLQGDAAAFERGAAFIDSRLRTLLWTDASPLGDRVTSSFAAAPLPVAGIVGTVREWNQGADTVGAVYAHYRQHPRGLGAAHLVVRYRGDAEHAAAVARQALAGIDPLVPIETARLDTRVAAALDGRRVVVAIAAVFGVVALLLAAGGVHGMIAFIVARGRREAAIRLALGATPSEIGRRVVATGLGPWLAGSLAGLGAAVPVTGVIRAQLFQVETLDPVVCVTAIVVMLAAALVASAVPARRSARVDPVSALRLD